MTIPTGTRRFTSALLAATGLLFAGASQAPVGAAGSGSELLLVNLQTAKCLTIAGGVSTANNVEALQFDCDDHPSRRWMLTAEGNDVYQIRNVETGKCLTIAGGLSTDNIVTALQFDCDAHPSRRWRVVDITGSAVYQIRNVQTHKCLTIAGGLSTANNVTALQFSCDEHPSRRWTLRAKL
jgi:phosphoribosylanthranilate isomerase